MCIVGYWVDIATGSALSTAPCTLLAVIILARASSPSLFFASIFPFPPFFKFLFRLALSKLRNEIIGVQTSIVRQFKRSRDGLLKILVTKLCSYWYRIVRHGSKVMHSQHDGMVEDVLKTCTDGKSPCHIPREVCTFEFIVGKEVENC